MKASENKTPGGVFSFWNFMSYFLCLHLCLTKSQKHEKLTFFPFFSSISFDVVLLSLGFVYLQISRFVWNCPFGLICFMLSIWDLSDVICILLVDKDGGISLDGIVLSVNCGGMMSSDGTFCLQYVWSEFRLSGF